jgi:uncharacterized protein
MDVTPAIAVDRQLITRYGGGRFHVGGAVYEGSVLVFPERTELWPVSEPGQIDAAGLQAVLVQRPAVEILLLGCGVRAVPVPADARRQLSAAGITVEPMDTGAACRTYNVLLGEARRVAAALIAVD